MGLIVPDFVIRPTMASDRYAIIALMLQLLHHENAISGDRALVLEDAVACLAEDEGMVVANGGLSLVAAFGGLVVAYACCTIVEGGPYLRADIRRYGCVQTLVAAERHRNRGIAAALMVEAEGFTRARGLTSLKLGVVAGNSVAVGFYERNGFKPSAVEMVKLLC